MEPTNIEAADALVEPQFLESEGPLRKGDLIVIESGGRIVPRRPDDATPQWFVVLEDQNGREPVQLKPFNNHTSLHKARTLRVAGFT